MGRTDDSETMEEAERMARQAVEALEDKVIGPAREDEGRCGEHDPDTGQQCQKAQGHGGSHAAVAYREEADWVPTAALVLWDAEREEWESLREVISARALADGGGS